jgi:hypothetical protein
MFCQAVGIPQGELQEFNVYFSTHGWDVPQFPLAQTDHIFFLTLAHRWFVCGSGITSVGA